MKSIFHHFKGLSLNQMKQIFLEGEIPTVSREETPGCTNNSEINGAFFKTIYWIKKQLAQLQSIK